MRNRVTLVILAAALAALLCGVSARAQLTYNGGRSGGLVTLYSGEGVSFSAGGNPAPNALWIGVLSGSGKALIRDGAGHQTSNMTLNAGEVLVFQNPSPIFLQNQSGSSVQFYWGGTLLNKPPSPVCDTGLTGPILVMANKLMNFMAQSKEQGQPKLGVTVYLSNVGKTNGTLSYTQVGNWLDKGNYDIPVCSGSECCHPAAAVFPLKHVSGGAYTVYEINTSDRGAVDWDTAVPPPLTCTASAAPASGQVPLTVSFQASASGGSSGYEYRWKFGDGDTSERQNPTHVYTNGGTFTWKMTVTDLANVTCSKSGTITAISPLTVIASATPRSGDPPLTVGFGAIASGGNPPYAYTWSFGDGGSADQPAPTHTFIDQGAYDCRVTVKDAQNRSAQAAAPVYAGVPIPPTVSSVKSLTDPFRLKLTGYDFVSGCTATIDDAQVPQVQFKDTQTLIFKGSGLKSLVPKGRFVCIVVTNPDGGANDCFWYQR